MSARDPHSSPTSPQRGAGGVGGGGAGGGKVVSARVILLNDNVHNFQVPPRAPGRELYYVVMRKLQILESDYFDLEYVDKEGIRCWLDHDKTLSKQFGSCKDLIFSLGVKFYTPHPNLLEEEYTRYLFALQIKKDIVNGFLPCNDNTSALLASYLVQMEIGDFFEEEYHDHTYLKSLKILHNPSDNMLLKVMEYHKTHIGLSPGEAEFHLLDTARKVELYGIRMHPAKDHEGLPLNLAVAHMGIIVFQNATKINTFSWAKIRKLSFKRKKFLIKLHPEGYGYYKDTVEFYFESRDECKNFWKKCIEHHAFFRCQAVKKAQRRKTRVVSKGSSFRYSGRTQKQLIEYVRENSTRRPLFERSSSCRVSSKSPSASRHSGRLPPLHASSHSAGGSTGGGVAHGGTLNSSASARSRTVSTSSGSHTMASSREHIPHLRSVSQSPPARRAPAPSRSRSLGAEGEETLHPGAPASDAQSHRPQTPQHQQHLADSVAAAASGSCGHTAGGSSGGGGTGSDKVMLIGGGSAVTANANDPTGSAVTLGRVLCIDRVSYSTGSVSHTSSESDETRQQQQQQARQQQTISHIRSPYDADVVTMAGRGNGEDAIELQKKKSASSVDGRTPSSAITTNGKMIVSENNREEEIPYVLHKRHISPSSTTRSLSRHQRTKSPGCPPKSPRVLREEYLSRQRRVDRGEIEQLKAELRSHGPITGPVSAYRLPPVNAYSALDDTLASPSPADCPAARLDLLSRLTRPRTRRAPFSSLSQPNVGRHRQPLYQSSSSSGSECSLEDAWLRERKGEPDSVSDFEVRIQTPRARSLASSQSASSSSSLEARLASAGPGVGERRSAGDSSSSSSAAACGPSSSLLTAQAVADVLRVPMDLSTTSESSGGGSLPRPGAQLSSSSSSERSDSEDEAAFLHVDGQGERSREPSLSSQLDQAEIAPAQDDNNTIVFDDPSNTASLRQPSVPGLMVTSPSPLPPREEGNVTTDKPTEKPVIGDAKSEKSVDSKDSKESSGTGGTPPPPPPPKPPRSLIGSSASSSSSSTSGEEEQCAAGPEDPYEAQFESSCTEADGEVPLEEEEARSGLIGPVPSLSGASPIVYLNNQYRDEDDDDEDDEDTERDLGTTTPTGARQGSGNSGGSRSHSSGGSAGRYSLEETVERNLQCGMGGGAELVDSSLERVPSEEDGDEVDEFVLDEESSSTDNDDSEDDSASEGSEEIEPFPPPPPELLAFSEEDEEAVAAAERGTNGYHVRHDNLSRNNQHQEQQNSQRETSPQ